MNTGLWLPRALEESRARGFLGPQPIEPQITHSLGFSRAWDSARPAPPASFLDLGSGGGLPGLVLLDEWRCGAVFLDSMQKRGRFLREVLEWDDAPPGGQVVIARAEEAARWPEFEGAFDLVTTRSFGPPAVTLECAARFLRIGGLLVVSEPPEGPEDTRWPQRGVALLGFRKLATYRFGSGYAVLEKTRETDREFPRASGTPRKRPLF